MMKPLDIKVLRIAAQICDMHGHIAGDRVCQDWTGDTEWLDDLTPVERDKLMKEYEDWNSQGKDFEPGYFPYDEMLISFVVSTILSRIAEEQERLNVNKTS